jgi:hypothetical protein
MEGSLTAHIRQYGRPGHTVSSVDERAATATKLQPNWLESVGTGWHDVGT